MPDSTLPDSLIMNCNFSISSKIGNFKASKVRSIEQSVNYETIREGGFNDGFRYLITPPSGLNKLIFERGYCVGYYDFDFYNYIGIPQYDDPLIINIYDRQHKEIIRSYSAFYWMIVKWQISDLDALSNAVLIETVEVVYQKLTREG